MGANQKFVPMAPSPFRQRLKKPAVEAAPVGAVSRGGIGGGGGGEGGGDLGADRRLRDQMENMRYDFELNNLRHRFELEREQARHGEQQERDRAGFNNALERNDLEQNAERVERIRDDQYQRAEEEHDRQLAAERARNREAELELEINHLAEIERMREQNQHQLEQVQLEHRRNTDQQMVDLEAQARTQQNYEELRRDYEMRSDEVRDLQTRLTNLEEERHGLVRELTEEKLRPMDTSELDRVNDELTQAKDRAEWLTAQLARARDDLTHSAGLELERDKILTIANELGVDTSKDEALLENITQAISALRQIPQASPDLELELLTNDNNVVDAIVHKAKKMAPTHLKKQLTLLKAKHNLELSHMRRRLKTQKQQTDRLAELQHNTSQEADAERQHLQTQLQAGAIHSTARLAELEHQLIDAENTIATLSERRERIVHNVETQTPAPPLAETVGTQTERPSLTATKGNQLDYHPPQTKLTTATGPRTEYHPPAMVSTEIQTDLPPPEESQPLPPPPPSQLIDSIVNAVVQNPESELTPELSQLMDTVQANIKRRLIPKRQIPADTVTVSYPDHSKGGTGNNVVNVTVNTTPASKQGNTVPEQAEGETKPKRRRIELQPAPPPKPPQPAPPKPSQPPAPNLSDPELNTARMLAAALKYVPKNERAKALEDESEKVQNFVRDFLNENSQPAYETEGPDFITNEEEIPPEDEDL